MIPRRTSDGRAAHGRLARRTTAAAVGGRGSRAPSVATAGTGGRAQRRTARRGLAIYFAVLVPSSVAMYAVAIPYGIGWAAVGMFIPAFASTVARYVLHLRRPSLAPCLFSSLGKRRRAERREGRTTPSPQPIPSPFSASPRRVGRSVGSTPRFGRDC